MRRIADAEEAWAIPSRQPIDLDGEQLDGIPLLQFADSVGREWRELRYAVAERR